MSLRERESERVDYGSRRRNHAHPLSQFAARACPIHANETFVLNGEWLLQIYDAAGACTFSVP